MPIMAITFLNLDQGWNCFQLVRLKNDSKVRKQSRTCPQEKIKKRKKGTWIKLDVTLGPRNVNSGVIGV